VSSALGRFAAAGAPCFYWRSADGSVELIGTGESARIETSGARRFADAAEQAEALFARLERAGADGPAEAGPILVGGFGFWPEAPEAPAWRGFPSLRFWLPARLLARVGERWYETETGRDAGASAHAVAATAERGSGFSASSSPSPAEFERSVERALGAIAAGALEKVVLARACRLRQAQRFDPARTLAALAAAHPGCFAYGIGLDDATFVGASPERLIARRGDEVRADALAGSAPRGRTPQEDELRARALRESKKEQAEHEVVRHALVTALAPFCTELAAPEAPALLRLEGIQHLHTPVRGRLAPGAPPLLGLAGAVFPSPAIAGEPREAALEFLRAHERAERGWYSGGVGWLSPGGGGELAVALRCALLREDCAWLHAGAGIVAGSTPEAELVETRWKLQAALGALVEL
jgi:isochorismate synthase